MQQTVARPSLDSLNLNEIIIKLKANTDSNSQLLNLVDLQDAINNESNAISTKQKIFDFKKSCASLANNNLQGVTAKDVELTVSIYHNILPNFIQRRIAPFTDQVVKNFINYMILDNNSGISFKHGLAWMPFKEEKIQLSNSNYCRDYELNELEFNLVANSLGLNLMLEEIYEIVEESKDNGVPKNLITNLLGIDASNLTEMLPRLELLNEMVSNQHENIYSMAFGSENEYLQPYGDDQVHPAKPQRDQHLQYVNMCHFLT